MALNVEGWAWRPPGVIAALPNEDDHRYLIRWPNGEDGRWPESYLVPFSPADQWAAVHKLADESSHLRETIAGLLAVGTRVRYLGDGKPLLYGSGELTPGTAGTLVDASHDRQSALVRWDVPSDLTCWFGPTWTKPLSSLEYRPEDQPGHPYAQTPPRAPTEQDTTA